MYVPWLDIVSFSRGGVGEKLLLPVAMLKVVVVEGEGITLLHWTGSEVIAKAGLKLTNQSMTFYATFKD